MNITKEEFESYLEVQESGITNMFDVKVVSELSGLSKGQIIHIMGNYLKLKEKYGEL